MASGMSNVSRSNGVASEARQTRKVARELVGRVSPLRAAPRLRDDGPHGVTRPTLRAFDEGDFFRCEIVEFILETTVHSPRVCRYPGDSASSEDLADGLAAAHRERFLP